MPSPSRPAAAPPIPTSWLWALGIGFAAFCLQMIDVGTYPLVEFDNAFLNDAGLQLVLHGSLRSDVLKANQGFDGLYFWQPPGLALIAAAAYELFGFGVWQTRLGSILFSAAASAALYLLVEKLTGRRHIALAAAVITLVWPDFVQTSKSARMDSPAIFFLLMATLFTLCALETAKARWAAVAAGLCIGFAGIFHTAAITWAIGLVSGATLLLWRKDRVKIVLMIGAAAILPAAWLIDALVHLQTFQEQFLVNLASRAAEGGPLTRVAEEVLRYAGILRRLPLALPLLVLLIVVALRSLPATPAFRLIAVMTLVTVVANFFMAGKHSGFYQVYPTFCVIILGAAVWAHAIETNLPPRLCLAGLVIYGLAILNMAAITYLPRTIAMVAQSRSRNYALQYKELTSRLRPGDQVWGSAVAWNAIVKAGARLDAGPESVPLLWTTQPDPAKHRFAVVTHGMPFEGTGFRKIGEYGEALPSILGSTYSSHDYRYALWASTQLEPARR